VDKSCTNCRHLEETKTCQDCHNYSEWSQVFARKPACQECVELKRENTELKDKLQRIVKLVAKHDE
jgi:hypothetical protein